MPTYRAIPIEGVTALNSQFGGIKWRGGSLTLDFSITDKPMIVRAMIKDCVIFRVLTDCSVPPEEVEDQEGLSRDHLAYAVRGAYFHSHHAETVFDSPVGHYRFVTENSVVDVLSRGRPAIRALGVLNYED